MDTSKNKTNPPPQNNKTQTTTKEKKHKKNPKNKPQHLRAAFKQTGGFITALLRPENWKHSLQLLLLHRATVAVVVYFSTQWSQGARMEISLKRHRSNLNAVIKVKKKKKRSTWHEKQKLLVFSLSEAAVLKEKKC